MHLNACIHSLQRRSKRSLQTLLEDYAKKKVTRLRSLMAPANGNTRTTSVVTSESMYSKTISKRTYSVKNALNGIISFSVRNSASDKQKNQHTPCTSEFSALMLRSFAPSCSSCGKLDPVLDANQQCPGRPEFRRINTIT